MKNTTHWSCGHPIQENLPIRSWGCADCSTTRYKERHMPAFSDEELDAMEARGQGFGGVELTRKERWRAVPGPGGFFIWKFWEHVE